MSESLESIILQGASKWNDWIKKNKGPIHFAKPFWYDSRDRNGILVKGANSINFSGINLIGASVHEAFAEGLNLHNAKIINCHFEEGDFSRANFSNTTFRVNKLHKPF